MLFEIIQRLINSNTIINPNEISVLTYWNLVYTNELSVNKDKEDNDKHFIHYLLYSLISSIYYIPSQKKNMGIIFIYTILYTFIYL